MCLPPYIKNMFWTITQFLLLSCYYHQMLTQGSLCQGLLIKEFKTATTATKKTPNIMSSLNMKRT